MDHVYMYIIVERESNFWSSYFNLKFKNRKNKEQVYGECR